MKVILMLCFLPFISGFSAYKSYNFLDKVEGTKLVAYPDGKKGRFAICKGNNFKIDGTLVKEKDTSTLKNCNKMRNFHVKNRVMRHIYNIKLKEYQMIAIVSYIYRHGGKGSAKLRFCARKNNLKCVRKFISAQDDIPKRRIKLELSMWDGKNK